MCLLNMLFLENTHSEVVLIINVPVLPSISSGLSYIPMDYQIREPTPSVKEATEGITADSAT